MTTSGCGAMTAREPSVTDAMLKKIREANCEIEVALGQLRAMGYRVLGAEVFAPIPCGIPATAPTQPQRPTAEEIDVEIEELFVKIGRLQAMADTLEKI